MTGPARTTMTRKGQVTIPKSLRLLAGLAPGETVEVEAVAGMVTLRSAEPEEVRRRFRATLARFKDQPPLELVMPTDEYMALIREPLEPFELDPAFRPCS